MKKLNAVTLKNELWDTLLKVKDGQIEASKGDAIASQAREILRTTKTQLQIITKAKEEVTQELKSFAMESE